MAFNLATLVEDKDQDQLLKEYELVYSYKGTIKGEGDIYDSVRAELDKLGIWNNKLDFIILESIRSITTDQYGDENSLFDMYFNRKTNELIVVTKTDGLKFTGAIQWAMQRKEAYEFDEQEEATIGRVGLVAIVRQAKEVGFVTGYISPLHKEIEPLPFSFYLKYQVHS